MSRESGPVLPLEQKCIEPGHWLIEGRHVCADYEGRSRKIQGWYIRNAPAGTPPSFLYLADVREWIRDQEAR